MSFLFFAYNWFFKDVNWFSIPNPNFWVHSIRLNIMEKMFLFVLAGSGLLIKADLIKSRGSMVVNDLQFYKKD